MAERASRRLHNLVLAPVFSVLLFLATVVLVVCLPSRSPAMLPAILTLLGGASLVLAFVVRGVIVNLVGVPLHWVLMGVTVAIYGKGNAMLFVLHGFGPHLSFQFCAVVIIQKLLGWGTSWSPVRSEPEEPDDSVES